MSRAEIPTNKQMMKVSLRFSKSDAIDCTVYLQESSSCKHTNDLEDVSALYFSSIRSDLSATSIENVAEHGGQRVQQVG